MINLTQRTYNEISIDIAKRLAAVRKRKKISQAELANRSGVSFASVKRFERTGEVSLTSLIKMAIALGTEDDMDQLFANVPFLSIEEVINGQGK